MRNDYSGHEKLHENSPYTSLNNHKTRVNTVST